MNALLSTLRNFARRYIPRNGAPFHSRAPSGTEIICLNWTQLTFGWTPSPFPLTLFWLDHIPILIGHLAPHSYAWTGVADAIDVGGTISVDCAVGVIDVL